VEDKSENDVGQSLRFSVRRFHSQLQFPYDSTPWGQLRFRDKVQYPWRIAGNTSTPKLQYCAVVAINNAVFLHDLGNTKSSLGSYR
jgi:hypothetical protein